MIFPWVFKRFTAEQVERAQAHSRPTITDLLLVEILHVCRQILARIPVFAPSSPTQAGELAMSTVVLTDTLPTTRIDGSALAATDIASITYQKASLSGSPPVLGAPVALQTNSAQAGASLQPSDLTFTDPNPAPGDTYTSFVTDTAGHISAPSGTFVVPAQQAAPSAPTQTAVFNP